jgi:hypothetical protein
LCLHAGVGIGGRPDRWSTAASGIVALKWELRSADAAADDLPLAQGVDKSRWHYFTVATPFLKAKTGPPKVLVRGSAIDAQDKEIEAAEPVEIIRSGVTASAPDFSALTDKAPSTYKDPKGHPTFALEGVDLLGTACRGNEGRVRITFKNNSKTSTLPLKARITDFTQLVKSKDIVDVPSIPPKGRRSVSFSVVRWTDGMVCNTGAVIDKKGKLIEGPCERWQDRARSGQPSKIHVSTFEAGNDFSSWRQPAVYQGKMWFGYHKRFYAIAHMVNRPQAVHWAVGQGANALEVDITFNEQSGLPMKILHGHPCDCGCFNGSSQHVCSQLGGFGHRCAAETPLGVLMKAMASHKDKVALVIFDSKALDLEDGAQRVAGRNIIRVANQHLFGNGYRGVLVITAPHRAAFTYLRSAAEEANRSKNVKRIYFGFDQENSKNKTAGDTLRLLTKLPTRNRAYGAGITTCMGIGNYHPEMKAGARNIAAGSLAFSYTWSYNDAGAMSKYIDSGAIGVMTNYPKRLVELAKRKGLQLAAPSDPLQWVCTDNVVE